MVANLAWSLARGAPAGPDPWRANTLEWSIPSPPPAYNFRVIPIVTSADPNWDRGDREADARELERDEISVTGTHETPVSTVSDAFSDGVASMPEESPWPVLLAVCVTAIFALLLTSHYYAAGLVAVVGLFCLFGWHSTEPEPA